jgi:hypothetical protein
VVPDDTTAPAAPQAHARPRRAIAIVASWLIGIVLLVFGALAQVQGSGAWTVVAAGAAAFAGVSALTAGAILGVRVPHNPIGWLLLAGGLLLAIAYAGSSATPLGMPAALWAAWVTQSIWVPAVALLGGVVPLLFPTGHLPSPRWRVLLGVAFTSIAFSILNNAFGGGPVSVGNATYPNPLGVSGSAADLLAVGNDLSTLVGIVTFLLVAASLLVRYQVATGIERQQLKWFAAAGGLAAVAFAFAIGSSLVDSPAGEAVAAIAWPLTFIGFGLIPLAIGIAVLRYRLYDIDVILRRTAVYVPLTAVLAGVFAASLAISQRLFVGITGNTSDAAVVISTLILATAFTPIKNALQGWVDRTFRDARDADRRLAQFVMDIATAYYLPSPERVVGGYLHLVIDVTGASGGAAFVGPAGAERLIAESPERVSGPTTVVEIADGKRHVGRLVLDARRDGTMLRPRDLASVVASAEQLVAAIAPAGVPERGWVSTSAPAAHGTADPVD